MSPTPDPLVRAALGAGPAPAGPHPDAEVLGLYAERALEGDERRGVETHVAACVRCQAIVAQIAVTAPDDLAAAGPAGAAGVLGWFSGWRWVVPVASLAAAAIVAVWIGQPPSERSSGAAPASFDSALNAPAASPTTVLAPSLSRPPATTPAAPSTAESRPMAERVEAGADRRIAADPVPPAEAPTTSNSTTPAREKTLAGQTADNPVTTRERVGQAPAVTLADAVAPSAPAASAPVAAGASAEARAETAAAPAAAAKRAGAASTPAGRQFLAVAEVSPRVAWAIAAGAVFRTTDGDTWTAVSPPPGAPFSAVTATGADRATVTAADGARYATTDGGRTWRRTP